METIQDHPQKLYTVEETSARRGMSTSFWRREVRLRNIDFTKVGKAVRLTDEAVDKFFEKYSTKQTA